MAKKQATASKARVPLLIIGALALLGFIGGLVGILLNKDNLTPSGIYWMEETTFIKNASEGDEFTLSTRLELPFWSYDESESFEFTEIDRQNLLVKVVKNTGESIDVSVSNAYQTIVYTVSISQSVFPVKSISLNESDLTFKRS